MKAKKRTVWLLTLSSLVAVITVFIIFDPARELSIREIFTSSTFDETILTGVDDKLPVTTDNHHFEQLRIELSNERSKLREQYLSKIASSQISVDEKNETYNLLNYLIERESSEAMVETFLKSLGYAEAFVQIDEGKVNVTIVAEELSKEKVNEVVFLVKTEVDPHSVVTVNVKSDYY